MDLYFTVRIQTDDDNFRKCNKDCWFLQDMDTCIAYRMFLAKPKDTATELPFRCGQCMELAQGGIRGEAFDREMKKNKG